VTALALLGLIILCASVAFIAYWHGVADAEARHRDEVRRHRALEVEHDRVRAQYALTRELNVDLAHQVSDLRMRETFDRIVEDWR
jgi:uncharacterized membrane protein